jgi:Ca2+-binding RTX toxin-like protein
MGGTSQAVPYISAIATLGQQIARTYLGRELTLTEFRTLLDTTSNLIIDGDDENDNVTNTGISYPRINALALAENILNLNDSNSNPDLVNPGNNNNNGSNTVTNTVSLVHNVTLTAGQILTGINFGNQQLPSNQPPTLNNINKSGDEDNPINFSQSDFTSAFNDADGNTLVKIQITALPNNGVLQLNNTAIAINEEIAVSDLNNLTFSPNTNFNGNITFSWNGFDGSVYSINSAQVNLTVNPVDDAPTVLNPITDVNVDEDAENSVINLSNVFSDVDGDVIVKTVFVNNNPGLVTATIVDNQLTLDYQDNQSGIANITIRGTSNGKTVDDTLVVTVNPVNDAPTLQQEIANQTATENQPFSFTIPANTFTDIDDDNLTYTLATETVLPSGITFDAATGTFSGTPSDTASGTYNLTVIASDSAGEKANDSFSLNVLNAVNGDSSNQTVNGTSGNDHINAGAGNDTVNGGEGNDILDGGPGNDRLAGGPGDDTYIVDNSRDVVIESAGEGKDAIKSSVNYTLTVNIEDITLTGNANIDGTGNNLDNLITGNSGHNLLKGLDGNDTLLGSAGNDTLIGGKGNDILTGGDGSDSFLFGSGAIFNSSDFGVDSISDFIKGTDKIILSKTSFNALVSTPGNSLQAAEFAAINDAANELDLVGSSSAKIVYNLATGNLFYNQNGATAGLGNGALFVTLNSIQPLNENDIFLQA